MTSKDEDRPSRALALGGAALTALGTFNSVPLPTMAPPCDRKAVIVLTVSELTAATVAVRSFCSRSAMMSTAGHQAETVGHPK